MVTETRAPRTRRRTAEGSLDEKAWVRAAQAVLADAGVEAVRVEPLAKSLKVTKGSFYWHFKDRDALLEAVLSDWRRRAVMGVIRRVERSNDTPLERLRRLMEYPISDKSSPSGVSLELALRLWAKRDRRAKAAVEEVDEHRLAYISALLESQGHSAPGAQAFLVYAFILTEAYVPGLRDPDVTKACEERLLAPISSQATGRKAKQPALKAG